MNIFLQTGITDEELAQAFELFSLAEFFEEIRMSKSKSKSQPISMSTFLSMFGDDDDDDDK